MTWRGPRKRVLTPGVVTRRLTVRREPRNCLICGAAFTAVLPRGFQRKHPGRARYCSNKCWMEGSRRRNIAKQRATFEKRFWARVDKSAGPDACWPWTGGTVAKEGYGIMSLGGRSRTASRISIELTQGHPVPKGLFVCHHCDNPPCCNPAHLYVGTNADNMDDRFRLAGLPLTERRRIREAKRAGA